VRREGVREALWRDRADAVTQHIRRVTGRYRVLSGEDLSFNTCI
jgi:hypothetical protein